MRAWPGAVQDSVAGKIPLFEIPWLPLDGAFEVGIPVQIGVLRRFVEVTPLRHHIAAAILQLHIFDFCISLKLLGFRCRQSTLLFLGVVRR